MISNYTSVIAGEDIAKDQRVQLQLEDDVMVAYPVRPRYLMRGYPVAVEDAVKGDIICVKS